MSTLKPPNECNSLVHHWLARTAMPGSTFFCNDCWCVVTAPPPAPLTSNRYDEWTPSIKLPYEAKN